jgi:hypothetical protein
MVEMGEAEAMRKEIEAARKSFCGRSLVVVAVVAVFSWNCRARCR